MLAIRLYANDAVISVTEGYCRNFFIGAFLAK